MTALTRTRTADGAASVAARLPEVLVVEDDEAIREAVAELLEHAGYAVQQAKDGLDALEHFEHHAPDAIVLDLMLPRLSGWEFLERSRTAREHSSVPVLILSALDAQPHRLGTSGASAWLTKPVEAEHLLKTIAELLTERAPRVLVIDDEPIIRELLVEHIGDEGYIVDSARTIAQARAYMRLRRPDLIVLDLMLPGNTGWDFLRERQADPLLTAIPVVVISAAPRERLDLATELGADALLSKPFDLGEVTALVRRFVSC